MRKTYTPAQFQAALKRLGEAGRAKSLANIVESGARIVEGKAKVNIVGTFKNQTGNLANSFVIDVAASKDRAMAQVGPTAVYGRIQELGGTIRPLVKRRLHWVDEEGNHHQAELVTLPARPYLTPAVTQNEDEILNVMNENLKIEIEAAL